MRISKLGILLCVIYIFLVIGCDPVRKTLQPVRLQIANSTTEQSVVGAQVWMRYDYERNEPLSEQEQRPSRREVWNQTPWDFGASDKQGQATVDIGYVVLDRTIGSKPPSWRDWVTEKAYLVLIRKDQVHEEFSLVIQPGVSLQGKFFTVSVIGIQEPRYVKMD